MAGFITQFIYFFLDFFPPTLYFHMFLQHAESPSYALHNDSTWNKPVFSANPLKQLTSSG